MKSRIVFALPPEDSIQLLELSPSGSLLAVSAWNSAVYLYDTHYAKLLYTARFDCPALALSFYSDEQLVVGLCDGRVLMYSTVSAASSSLYKHSQTVRFLHCYGRYVFSCSYDETAVLYDCDTAYLKRLQLPSRPFCGCFFNGSYYVALASRVVVQITGSLDIKATFESPLRHQTRAICVGPLGLCLGSVEGRVAVQDVVTHDNYYAFRAHKIDNISYPINALCFVGAFLASAGSDGRIYFWDLKNRKKVYKIAESYCVSAICAGQDYFYVAKSYNWERLEKGRTGEEIAIVAYKISEIGV